VRSARFRPVYKWFFWIFLIDCLVLGWVGANSPDAVFYGIPFIRIGQLSTFYYFAHFLLIIPAISLLERPKPLPSSISKPVLEGGGGHAGAAAKPMGRA
jgi:ubiquinol-cytochrome c reductase cytochrome b/c1 subunit